jgi:hypothetical protein
MVHVASTYICGALEPRTVASGSTTNCDSPDIWSSSKLTGHSALVSMPSELTDPGGLSHNLQCLALLSLLVAALFIMGRRSTG